MNAILNAIKSVWAWIRTDGLLHILMCTVLMLIYGIWFNWWVSAILVLVVGIVKEVYDRATGLGCAEWHDIYCDLIGIAMGIILLLGYAI